MHNGLELNMFFQRPWRFHRPTVVFLLQFITIYINTIMSNIAVRRWGLLESVDAIPDIVHDNVGETEIPILDEGPQSVLFALVIMNSLVYDFYGKPRGDGYVRWEAWCRYLETRMIMDLMRASTVWVTNIPDPRGHDCTEHETFHVENVFTTFTFARCGDNIFSGHASNLLSLAIVVQYYVFANPAIKSRQFLHLALSVLLWVMMAAECFYIVTARLHYTVDVMLAVYLCFAVWWAYMPSHWGSENFFVWWEVGTTRSGAPADQNEFSRFDLESGAEAGATPREERGESELVEKKSGPKSV